ncbi:hypothetical protein [Lichenifustis flavocetrariae]|uniref:Uncharacterized protein n=1 Tax=Lichenifustis flavocetrariae TaxID=2949735 RepID=A0AA41YWM5_9HYPH|nr:hypothetical protein [Lichenifustis flavocetrariae]MCW6508338.1 hypothetical protein [Lichenifustis flavocetrariae]
MSKSERAQSERADPKSHEGFIARAYDTEGLKAAVKEAAKLFSGYSDKEALDAAATMQSKVRTAVMKMVNSRKA